MTTTHTARTEPMFRVHCNGAPITVPLPKVEALRALQAWYRVSPKREYELKVVAIHGRR